MNVKVLGALVILVAIVGGAYWWAMHGSSTPVTAPASYSWVFEDKTTDQSKPRTQVTLVVNNKEYVVGTYDGTCSDQDTDLLPDEKLKAVCWFAGGGKEIGLFQDAGTWTVQAGDIDEGSADTAGFRGNFETIVSL